MEELLQLNDLKNVKSAVMASSIPYCPVVDRAVGNFKEEGYLAQIRLHFHEVPLLEAIERFLEISQTKNNQGAKCIYPRLQIVQLQGQIDNIYPVFGINE